MATSALGLPFASQAAADEYAAAQSAVFDELAAQLLQGHPSRAAAAAGGEAGEADGEAAEAADAPSKPPEDREEEVPGVEGAGPRLRLPRIR